MSPAYSMIGSVIIVVLYATVGLLAATGTLAITRRTLSLRAEQIFFAVFFMMIAAFYLAFAAYFRMAEAWRLEIIAVAAFVAVGAVGTMLPQALVLGYLLHAVWDMLHELQAHEIYSAFHAGQITMIPLAYGVFCAAFDILVAAYFFARSIKSTIPAKLFGGETA